MQKKTKVLYITISLIYTILSIKIFANTNTNNTEFPKLNIFGFTKINFITDTNPSTVNSFTISSSRIGVKGSITQLISYTLALEPTNNNSMLYDIFLDINLIPYFNLRVGQFKYKFGLEQLIPDENFELINKSEVVNNLINPNRDIGIELSKKFKLKYLNPSIFLGIFNGNGTNKADDNEHKTFIGKISFIPIENFNFGISTYLGSTGLNNTKKDRTAFDILYKQNNLSLKTEYIISKDDNIETNGYYFTVLYSINNFDFITRYDTYNVSDVNINNRITLGTNYFFDKNVVLRTNYEFKSEKPSIDNDLLSLQLQIKF